jgi:hypothetical protein
MFPQRSQTPPPVDWYLLHKAQVDPDATIGPKWVFGLTRLKARGQLLITLSQAV